MEKYYKEHLHRKDTLRSTSRGGVVKLIPDDILNHTLHQDENNESEDMEDSEEDKPRKKRKVTDTGKRRQDRPDQLLPQFHSQVYAVAKGLKNMDISNPTQRGLVVPQQSFVG